MKLSRLEVIGFKTFARKLDVRLVGGITAIVGPNGCGKSNVVDAIRWVLGEQKPTQIRLERMEDVIFKGTPARKQLGMAEVSLTIDNESSRLSLNMPEITVTRRLFRSGESEYLLNSKICRLADINDLFMDTGMGTDSYSVFELGMINSILSDKTEDRRLIFEEAAGVTKYKNRRRTALNRMLSIDDDLNRVGDIIAELDRRVDSLKRQAQKASRYRSLRSEIKARMVAVGAHEIGKLRGAAGEAEEELSAVQVQTENLRTSIASLSEEYEAGSIELLDAERGLEDIATRFNLLRNDIAEREKEVARLDSRIEYLQQTTEKSHESARQNALNLDRIAERHGAASAEWEKVSGQLKLVESAEGELREQYADCRKRVVELDFAHQSMENECRRLEREIASCRSMITAARIRREGGEARLSEIVGRAAELEQVVREAESELARLREDRLQYAGRERGLVDAVNGIKSELAARREEIEAAGADLRKAGETQASLRAERDFLAEVIRTYAGYSEGVRNAVGAEELEGRTLSVLADCISTDDRYVLAIEAALSDSLQGIVVDSPEAALDGARYLANDTRGRAVFIPVNAPGSVHPGGEITEAGVIGPAADFVRTTEQFRPVVKKLLRDVYIVDSLETAWRLHVERGGRFVTLDGAMSGAYGEIHSGRSSDGDRSVMLGRREKLERLEAELERVSQQIRSRSGHFEALSGTIETLSASISEKERALEELRGEIAAISSDEAHFTARKNASAESLAVLRKESERIRESFDEYEAEILEWESKSAEYEEKFRGLKAESERAAREIADQRSELEDHQGRLNACEVERASLAEKRISLAREIETASEQREELSETGKKILEEISRAEEEMLTAGNRKQELAGGLQSLGSEYDRLSRMKEETERAYNELRSRRSENERTLQNLRREQSELTKRESALVLEREEAILRARNIIERLVDEFFIAPEDIPEAPDNPDFDPDNERLLIEDLRRKIQATGDVNMAAEEDYRTEKERLDFLTRERDDLVEARRTIEETIQRINHIARERFKETFERIRVNFTKTFGDFFEGGFCDLALEENEDPLEASILITARPPGKNVKSINLLSSGERALTAISLLFAIYLVKPSPFCILDEVDAPLDDANIDRFLRVIREFSKNTQFLMVTHNKKTMAAADNLYGITMDEPGLSTLVSVKLSQVEVSEKTGAMINFAK